MQKGDNIILWLLVKWHFEKLNLPTYCNKTFHINSLAFEIEHSEDIAFINRMQKRDNLKEKYE